jgi:CRISPR-associated endoribonuclease Cas6
MKDLRLFAVVFRLAAIHPGAVPAQHGDQARAALLELIRRGDFPLASRIHDENARKPYTISLLRGGKLDRHTDSANGARHFGEGDAAEWRFTLLGEPAFEALLKRYLLSRALPHVRVGAVEFAIVDAFASGNSHPDSGHVSIAELEGRYASTPERLPTRVTFDFQTPTLFSLGTDAATGERRFRALPEPRLVFSSLRKRWLALGGAAPGDVFDSWVGEHVDAEPLNLSTRKMIVEGRPVIGFIGQVRFTVRRDRQWLALLHLLADLTFWTGVGYQTTRGLGQVRRAAE